LSSIKQLLATRWRWWVWAMALLGLLATWIPARRALSVNPMILLREE
jgi:ABC-type lipoprotein release transport system permease subunit